LQEAERLGFTRVVVPRGVVAGRIATTTGLELLEAATVADAVAAALGGDAAQQES
jgi:DNA repair protein RadA/Sms